MKVGIPRAFPRVEVLRESKRWNFRNVHTLINSNVTIAMITNNSDPQSAHLLLVRIRDLYVQEMRKQTQRD